MISFNGVMGCRVISFSMICIVYPVGVLARSVSSCCLSHYPPISTAGHTDVSDDVSADDGNDTLKKFREMHEEKKKRDKALADATEQKKRGMNKNVLHVALF